MRLRQEERLFLPDVCQTDRFAHAIQADHLACQGRRVLQVVLCAGRHFAEDALLGCSPAEKARDAVDQVRTTEQELITGW